MLIQDMSKKQLKERSTFVKKLSDAGWDAGPTDELFESGMMDVSPEGFARYENAGANLELSYHAEDSHISLLIGAKDMQDFIKFRFYYGPRFAGALGAVIKAQDTLSRDEYTDFIKGMIRLCKEVFMEVEEEGLVRLS